jgi:transcriptional regulator with XRE-family HTH domain
MAEDTIDWGVLGERLLIARRRQQMTSAALAAKVGTSRVTISRLENGKKPHVSFEVIIRIAAALGVSLDFLAGQKEEKDEELVAAAVDLVEV